VVCFDNSYASFSDRRMTTQFRLLSNMVPFSISNFLMRNILSSSGLSLYTATLTLDIHPTSQVIWSFETLIDRWATLERYILENPYRPWWQSSSFLNFLFYDSKMILCRKHCLTDAWSISQYVVEQFKPYVACH
jgi:hypothetical protein